MFERLLIAHQVGHAPSLFFYVLYFVSLIQAQEALTLSCSANEGTEMKLKIYLSEAWMCSEFGYQRPMSNKKGLRFEVREHLFNPKFLHV